MNFRPWTNILCFRFNFSQLFCELYTKLLLTYSFVRQLFKLLSLHLLIFDVEFVKFG
jgi:hypothetical protein